ncbi:bifunctional protein-serine/threonine kinase/phosphatase [Oxalobacteraceae bacterium]|nr:bifunctional protein-serine/threonine kinase/phosphatase [Oxalobacteraceae bacterium]
MSSELTISVGQYSTQGRKALNQDFHGVVMPREPQLSSKGIAIALADGISSSDVSQIASQSAVSSFLEDYYCTSDAWSVKTSAERVMVATNSWLHAQTQQSQGRYDKDRGYVCTLSALVLKSTTAHLFHVGDSRVYHLRGGQLEQLSNDHRVWLSGGQSYLGRALGVNPQLEIDYRTVQMEPDDVFLLLTDGVYEFVDDAFLIAAIRSGRHALADAAMAIADRAFQNGSADNLTVQLLAVESLPGQQAGEVARQLSELELPPLLEPRMEFDGYTIIKELHASSRSHVHLAADQDSGALVVIKTPSIDLRGDAAYLERFLMEEWVARRINSAHVLKAAAPTRKRHYLYVVTEYIEGQSLAQWMVDHPRPALEKVRQIVEQIARGLQAFHRLEMLHQDLRPENILIDASGTVRIIDFGSTRVAGVMESAPPVASEDILGTAQYTAPEYFLGEAASTRSDIFSLGVIAYQMLTGRLPYGAQVAKSRTRAAQNKLVYQSALDEQRAIPAWIDGVLRKALHPHPFQRYGELSQFTHELRHPSQEFIDSTRPPIAQRNPLLFWKSLCCILLLIILGLLRALQQLH